jgi:hypothetical protein
MVLNVQSATSFLSKDRTESVHIVLLKGLRNLGMDGNALQVDLGGSFVFTTPLYAYLKFRVRELELHAVKFLSRTLEPDPHERGLSVLLYAG